MGDTMSFDECFEKKLSDCDPKKLWLQIPWFCGSFKKVKKYTNARHIYRYP